MAAIRRRRQRVTTPVGVGSKLVDGQTTAQDPHVLATWSWSQPPDLSFGSRGADPALCLSGWLFTQRAGLLASWRDQLGGDLLVARYGAALPCCVGCSTPRKPSSSAWITKFVDSMPTESLRVPPVIPRAARSAALKPRWLVDSG